MNTININNEYYKQLYKNTSYFNLKIVKVDGLLILEECWGNNALSWKR